MAKLITFGVSDIAKKVPKIYLGGADNLAHKIKKGYIGDENGIACQFYNSSYIWKRYSIITDITYKWQKYNIKTVSRLNKVQLQSPSNAFNGTEFSHNKYNFGWIGNADIDNADDVLTECNIINNGNSVGVSKPSGYYGYESWAGQSDIIDQNATVMIFANGTYKCTGSWAGVTYNTSFVWGSYFNNLIILGNQWNNSRHYAWKITATSENQKDAYLGDVTSKVNNAYPNNGISGSYWYVSNGSDTSYSQGTYIDQVESENPNAFPANGMSGDYWYVRQ